MVLTVEQSERFFDAMDALLLYVNDRFKVVDGFSLEYSGQIGDMKTALVAHALWDNVEIIDDFVRENPFRLPEKHLQSALRWKSALPGLYTVVRYQNGYALLMNDAGLFSVSGVTLELEGEIGKAPAYVDMVLLPFDDLIVYDGFLQAYDSDGGVAEAARIQDEFENRCANGIVSTAEEFERVAQAYLQSQRDKELDALLDDISRESAGENETLPAGFHRGVLAGLDLFDREAAIAAELKKRTEAIIKEWGEGWPGEHPEADETPRAPADAQADKAVNAAIACVLSRGVVLISEAYDQYCALVPDPLSRDEFDALVRYEASFTDSYFGLWSYGENDYLQYYTLTPDYLAKTAAQAASRLGGASSAWGNLREDLAYYETYRTSLLESRAEISAKPLSRTLLENTPLGELLRDESVNRLRRFLDERIPDGEDDYTFADMAAQEFALTSVESGSLESLYRLSEDLGIADCCTDETKLPRLATNVFNAMPSWENNGWSPQELYEQLTGRKMFYNEDGTVMKVGADDLCPCGSGKKFRDCCGR